jgi:hypothetical protein
MLAVVRVQQVPSFILQRETISKAPRAVLRLRLSLEEEDAKGEGGFHVRRT